jgi:hypothetical protein
LLACGDRQLVGCVRASNSVAEVGERRRAQRSVLPVAKGACGRERSRAGLERGSNGVRASRTGTVVAKPRRWGGQSRVPETASPGQGSSPRWKALQVVFLVVRSRGRSGAVLAALTSLVHARASWGSGRGDRSVRGRQARITTGRKRPSRRTNLMDPSKRSCSPPKRIALSWNRRLLDRTGAKAHDAKRTNDARVLIRRDEMAEVGPTHRALQRW